MKPLYIAVICVVSVIVLGAFSANQYNGEFKNLKVLPKDISSEKLQDTSKINSKILFSSFINDRDNGVVLDFKTNKNEKIHS